MQTSMQSHSKLCPINTCRPSHFKILKMNANTCRLKYITYIFCYYNVDISLRFNLIYFPLASTSLAY